MAGKSACNRPACDGNEPIVVRKGHAEHLSRCGYLRHRVEPMHIPNLYRTCACAYGQALTIVREGQGTYISLKSVKFATGKIAMGIAQPNTAVKENGIGAVC